MPRSSSLVRGLIPFGVIIALVSGCGSGPGDSSPGDTSAATTSPATTSPATTSPATTSPATTSPAATSPAATSPEAKVSQVCVAADAFAGALRGFKDILKPGVRSGDIRSARDQVEKTYDDLVEASADVARDRVEAVESATDDFREAVDALPEGATVSETIDTVRTEASDVQAALRGLTSELHC